MSREEWLALVPDRTHLRHVGGVCMHAQGTQEGGSFLQLARRVDGSREAHARGQHREEGRRVLARRIVALPDGKELPGLRLQGSGGGGMM